MGQPEAFKCVSSGGLSVQLNSSNPFGRVPVDQTCEETVNMDTQTSRGTKGFSLNPMPSAGTIWLPTIEALYSGNLSTCCISTALLRNKDHRSRIMCDETDVKNMISLLQDTWLNPLNPDLQDLVCLSTEKVAFSEVQDDLLRAKDVGGELNKAFKEQRLECDLLKVTFHDTKTKAKLKIFTDLNNKIKVKASYNQEVFLIFKAEKRLFAQMIVIAECRNLQMSEFLAHPLGPLPWKLANPDGTLRKTNKASLAKELQKN